MRRNIYDITLTFLIIVMVATKHASYDLRGPCTYPCFFMNNNYFHTGAILLNLFHATSIFLYRSKCVEQVKLSFSHNHQCNYLLIAQSVHLRKKQRSDTISDLSLLPLQCNGQNLDSFKSIFCRVVFRTLSKV